jgi:putative nucleotidyltransferase with HDIG domain
VKDRDSTRFNTPGFLLWLAAVSLGAFFVLSLGSWELPPQSYSKYWNGVAAFALLGIGCDSSLLPISRVSFAKLSSSVAFIPFLAAVVLFDHPWPMLIGGLTALVVHGFVRRKDFLRVWFNVVQYMLAVGLGTAAYRALGGVVRVDAFSFQLVPFLGLVVTFFAVNQLCVSVAVSFASGVSIRESWSRIVGGVLLYDFVSSSLAVLLAFLYVEFELAGLAILMVGLFFVRHMYHMNLQVEQVNRELLELMVKAIEARDPYTSGHSVRVAEYARIMARELGLSAKQVDNIATAALLHDVGKIYDEFAMLLRKEGRLTPAERMIMQTHPTRSAELVGTIGGLRGTVQSAIRHHHENFDGTGYPDGLAGDETPIGARIIMIADTIDAMTTDRPYRRARSFVQAMDELEKYAGTQFDPKLVHLVSKSVGIRRLLGPEQLGSADPAPVHAPRSQKPAWAERIAH